MCVSYLEVQRTLVTRAAWPCMIILFLRCGFRVSLYVWCAYVCMYVCIPECMYVFVHMYKRICIYVYMLCISIYVDW